MIWKCTISLNYGSVSDWSLIKVALVDILDIFSFYSTQPFWRFTQSNGSYNYAEALSFCAEEIWQFCEHRWQYLWYCILLHGIVCKMGWFLPLGCIDTVEMIPSDWHDITKIYINMWCGNVNVAWERMWRGTENLQKWGACLPCVYAIDTWASDDANKATKLGYRYQVKELKLLLSWKNLNL